MYPLFTGWWFQPLWKIWKSVGMIIPNIWKNKSHVPNHQTVSRWFTIAYYWLSLLLFIIFFVQLPNPTQTPISFNRPSIFRWYPMNISLYIYNIYIYSHDATISVGQILPIYAANFCRTTKRLHFAEPSPPSAANCPPPPGETASTDMVPWSYPSGRLS